MARRMMQRNSRKIRSRTWNSFRACLLHSSPVERLYLILLFSGIFLPMALYMLCGFSFGSSPSTTVFAFPCPDESSSSSSSWFHRLGKEQQQQHNGRFCTPKFQLETIHWVFQDDIMYSKNDIMMVALSGETGISSCSSWLCRHSKNQRLRGQSLSNNNDDKATLKKSPQFVLVPFVWTLEEGVVVVVEKEEEEKPSTIKDEESADDDELDKESSEGATTLDQDDDDDEEEEDQDPIDSLDSLWLTDDDVAPSISHPLLP